MAPAHTPLGLAAQDEEGESESAASGTTLLLVVVLRVRTYRTRELQPEHWSLLTYHELAKSWLPTLSKYPWSCATYGRLTKVKRAVADSSGFQQVATGCNG